MMHVALHKLGTGIAARAAGWSMLSLLAIALLGVSPVYADSDIDVVSPPGRMVDIGGYSLHIDCHGEGSPTVVLEAGLGGVSLEWLPVQRFLSHYSRVCTYDRAGNGWSDAGPEPRTTSVITDELYRLLHAAGEQAPYVLVGHSFGGYTAQMFAERYPDLTAGVVLIDSSHPDQVARFLAPPLNLNTAPDKNTGAVVLMSGPPPIPANLPEEVQVPAAMLMTTRKARVTVAQEYLYFRDSGEEILREAQMPPVPTVVITRGIDERSRHAADPKAAMIESLWMQMQDELAAMSPRSAHIVADRSGHHIHLDQPQLVVDAVSMVIDFARAKLANVPNDDAGSTWLAFNDATWRSDHLHRQSPNELPIAGLRQDLALQTLAGHLAWTHEPRAQRFAYAYFEGEGVQPVSFVR